MLKTPAFQDVFQGHRRRRDNRSQIPPTPELPQELVDHIIDCSDLGKPPADLEWNKPFPDLQRRELASYGLVSRTWMRSCSKYLLSRIFVKRRTLPYFLAQAKSSDRLLWFMSTLVITNTSHPIRLSDVSEILSLAPNVLNLYILSVRTDDLLSYDLNKPLAHHHLTNVTLSGHCLPSVPDFLSLFDSIETLQLADMGQVQDFNLDLDILLDALPSGHLNVKNLVLSRCKAQIRSFLPEILTPGCLRQLTCLPYPLLPDTSIPVFLSGIGQNLTEVTLVCSIAIVSSRESQGGVVVDIMTSLIH